MVNNLYKYYRVTSTLIRNCFSKETAYRWPFFFWVIVNLFWVGFSFYSIDLLFKQVPEIGGWRIIDAQFLVTVNALFSTLIWIFIMPNLIVFWRLINTGSLDFHLIKPLSARFLSSATFFEFDMIPRLIPVVIIFWILLGAFHRYIPLTDWLMFCLALLLGVFIFYNFGFIIATTCFWFTKIDSLEDLFNTVQGLGKYPPDIFKGVSSYIFVYIIPSIFISALPTMILLGKGKINIVTLEIVAAVISFLISQWFWNFALRHYSSASS